MPAATLTLPAVEKGATYEHTLYWKDSTGAAVDLTGCTAKLQIREFIESASPLLELSTENTRIAITALTGKIDLLISATDTAALAGKGGIYALEIYFTSGRVVRLCEGTIAFSPEVVRG